jgi:PLP dependent protein
MADVTPARRVFDDVSAERVARNLAEIRQEIGRDDVEVVAAVKYLPVEGLQALVDAGLTTVGENRAQELERKAAAYPDLFTWDFIGQLQSRKVKVIAPLVRRIHSVASDSALKELGKHGRDDLEILVEVNIAGEEGKAGIAPADLGAFIGRSPIAPVGLMTMPPLAADPEDSRRWFAALRDLAERHGLRHLSMGTTQDFAVAAQEGATIVRIGTRLFT